MSRKSMKFVLVAIFSLFVSFFSNNLAAQETPSKSGENKEETGKINPSKIILEHVSDAHEFHFATINNKPVSIPLPVILYSSGKGFSFFMSSAFHHGKEIYGGYLLMTEEFLKKYNLENAKDKSGQPLYKEGKIYATDVNSMPYLQTKVYDFSLTRNATQ